jgi:hypothetical protein
MRSAEAAAASIPAADSTASNASVNYPARSRIRNPEQVHQQLFMVCL